MADIPAPPLPTAEELMERSVVVALPMRARFRGITTREALLIEGPAGWGEFAPFVEYPDEEAAAWLRGALEAAYSGLPSPRRERVEVNATIPALPPAEAAALVERYPGCRTFKIKVAEPGQHLDDDVARVNAVREARPEARIRVDANGGWTVKEAAEAAARLGELEYLEQPCRSADELRELRGELARLRIDTPVAADESIRKAADPFRVARLRAAEVAVLKAAPLGGAGRLLDIARELSGHGMSVTVASALDTAVGMNAGLAAAANLPEGRAAGLATQRLFEADVAEPRPLVDGELPAAPVEPEPARLEALAAAPGRRDWWLDRLARCREVLALG